MDIKTHLPQELSFEEKEQIIQKWAHEIEIENNLETLELLGNVTSQYVIEQPENFVSTNYDINEDDLSIITSLFENLCTLCNSPEKIDKINKSIFWETTNKMILASTPTDDSVKYKPQISNEGMAKLLEAARNGEKLPAKDVHTNDTTDPEILRRRNLLIIWFRLRRAVFGCIRNAAQQSILHVRQEIASNEKLLDSLADVPRNAAEEGVIISYACTILRFLITPIENQRFVCVYFIFDWSKIY